MSESKNGHAHDWVTVTSNRISAVTRTLNETKKSIGSECAVLRVIIPSVLTTAPTSRSKCQQTRNQQIELFSSLRIWTTRRSTVSDTITDDSAMVEERWTSIARHSPTPQHVFCSSNIKMTISPTNGKSTNSIWPLCSIKPRTSIVWSWRVPMQQALVVWWSTISNWTTDRVDHCQATVPSNVTQPLVLNNAFHRVKFATSTSIVWTARMKRHAATTVTSIAINAPTPIHLQVFTDGNDNVPVLRLLAQAHWSITPLSLETDTTWLSPPTTERSTIVLISSPSLFNNHRPLANWHSSITCPVSTSAFWKCCSLKERNTVVSGPSKETVAIDGTRPSWKSDDSTNRSTFDSMHERRQPVWLISPSMIFFGSVVISRWSPTKRVNAQRNNSNALAADASISIVSAITPMTVVTWVTKAIPPAFEQQRCLGKFASFSLSDRFHFPFSCDFEKDLCQFGTLGTTELQFERAKAFQLINDYAPERDHTSNNLAGSFIYVKTLDQPANRTAQIRSSRFSSAPGCKARFYYYMNGASNPGQLTAMVRFQTFGPPTFVWSTNKILGDYWERQELLLPTGSLYELLFEVKSLGGGGFVALDDISFSPECNRSTSFLPYGTTTKPTGTTTEPTSCTYTCLDGKCVGKEKVTTVCLCFDSKMMTILFSSVVTLFLTVRKAKMKWIAANATLKHRRAVGKMTVPATTVGLDATPHRSRSCPVTWQQVNDSMIDSAPHGSTFVPLDKTSGFVMTIAGGTGSFAGSSRLVSERVASAAASCIVTFGLYRNRDRDGTLTLLLEDDAKVGTKLWTDPRTIVGRFWTPITVTVGRRRTGFRLVFVSTHVGSLISSDLSIDDVKFTDCGTETIGDCTGFPDPFNCSNGNCIHQDNVREPFPSVDVRLPSNESLFV